MLIAVLGLRQAAGFSADPIRPLYTPHTADMTSTPVGRTGTPSDRLHDRSGRGEDQVRRLDSDNPGADGMTPFHGVDHRAPDLLQMSCALSTGDGETRSASDQTFPGQRPYLSS
jgi:hypothetical protein